MPRGADVLTGAAAADEDMHRMEMCVGWIYEFFSRHRLEEAKKALVDNAEQRFQVSLDSLGQRFADPISILQVLLNSGKFEEAFQEFETQLEDFKPKIGEELYNNTLLQVMIQVALQGLRVKSGKKEIDDFKERVKALFPEASRSSRLAPVTSIAAATLAKVRLELMATTAKDVEKLLTKYSIPAFKESTVGFWRALRRVQPPTNLERVMVQIEDGIIQWNDPEEADADEGPPPRAAAGSVVPSAGSPAKSPAKAAGRSKEGAAVQGGAQSRKGTQKRGFIMTAWELREALAPDKADEDENLEWTDIHQQEHPEVKRFLQSRSRGQQERDSAEVVMIVDEEAEMAASKPKRRRVEAPAKGAGSSASARGIKGDGGAGSGKASVDTSPISMADTEEEDEEEELDTRGAKRKCEKGATVQQNDGVAIDAKDKVLIDQLQDKSKRLGEIGDDPLDAARANARGAKGGAPRIKLHDPDSKGRQITFDEDDGDSPTLHLPSTDTSFKPRRDIGPLGDAASLSNVGGRAAAKVGGSKEKRQRWSADEEEALREGVKEHGEGYWKKIKESFRALDSRSAVDIKDKWRNMQKKMN